jgi:putative ATP-binding cassette transporter
MQILSDFARAILLLAQLARRINQSRWTVPTIIASGIASGAINIAVIAMLSSSINKGNPAARTMVVYGLLCLLLGVTRFVSSSLLTAVTHNAVFHLRSKVCDQILATPLCTLERLGSPNLLATLTNDVSNISNALTTLPLLCMNITIVLGALAYLGWLAPLVLLYVLVALVIGIVIHQIPIRLAIKHFVRARESVDALFKYLTALVHGIKELQLHQQRSEVFFSRLLNPAALEIQRESITGETIWAATGSWDQTLLFIVIGATVFAARASNAISGTALTGYVFTMLYMMGPLEFILSVLPRISQADVSMKKVEELSVQLTSDPAVQPANLGLSSHWQTLELEGVVHSYERDGETSRFMLGPLTISFEPGELVFITGGNGSGKTTLAKILTGLYTPERGEVRWDSEPVTEENRNRYRQLFSVVFADFYLFEELIGLETPQLDERAQQLLVDLQLAHRVDVSEGKLSTINLSQGQRKRLALLTAYLEDRPIYLFDEWAADQDPRFKKLFYVEMLPRLLARGKTVIAITHDDHYYYLAHRIIKLEDGKVDFDRPGASRANVTVHAAS